MTKHRILAFKSAITIAGLLLCGALAALGQQQINLSAGPTTATLPDGSAVPMWGYSCGAVVAGSTAACGPLHTGATGWSPVLITVPTGQDLTISLTNNLTFAGGSIPTSLTIVGQLGGGLGVAPSRVPSPDHSGSQGSVTWPIADPTTSGTPPKQPDRVQSFGTEVVAGTTTALTWKAPRPGTYLIESGTHPSIQGPMGLYGILVVTAAPTGGATGTAYPGVPYDADVPLLLSEIDPVQNNAVTAAVNTSGFKETTVWSGKPGACGALHTCYPPAVNYTPLYYLFNGVAFDESNAAASVFSASTTATPLTGKVLVRLVNAGLRMHVPSIVGATTGASALGGFSLIAEDGNKLPGVPRVQSEVFLAAGKTYDVMINAPAAASKALPIFDRSLGLSGNSTQRDAGMLAYLSVNSATLPTAVASVTAAANADTYTSVVGNQTLTVSDPAKGVMANDVNVYGVKIKTAPVKGTVTLNANGTFTYTPDGTWNATSSDSFVYQATNAAAQATVTLSAAPIETASGIQLVNSSYTSNLATSISIKPPGLLAAAKDGAGYPLVVDSTSISKGTGLLTLTVDGNGGFNATVNAAGVYTFTYKVKNSQGTQSSTTATATLNFPQPTKLAVSLIDGKTKAALPNDYRWIIEEDRTFYVDPTKTTNTGSAGSTNVSTLGTNFHTSYMPLVAAGCVGTVSCESGQTLLGKGAVCDMGNGGCRTDASQQTPNDPSQVHLDPNKRYYLSVLAGDGANYLNANPTSGHGMGGAPIAAGQTNVTVIVEPTPLPPSKLTVFVFEDDTPLNGEQDSGGGVDVLAPNEPGLEGFNITIFDAAGGPGDFTGQLTYDMFNMPLSNSLAGTIDPATGKDACPVSPGSRTAIDTNTGSGGAASPTGITGTIVTCPKYESDGKTLSPLAGQAVIANMMPGRYGVVATPGADRIARGEEWLQTNTLDGQKAHDSFLKVGEPAFFQEYGPAGFHVSIGFANPKIINGRGQEFCAAAKASGQSCSNSIVGKVTTERMSRTPDERLYSSGSRDSFSFSQCFVSVGDPDGEDFAFTKCNQDGTFSISGLPDGDWRVTTFDQWNDQLVDGLSTPVRLADGKQVNMGDIAATQWQANLYTRTFFDQNGDGVSQKDEPGLALVATNIRFRDGSFSNFNSTDLDGYANFNEVFPLFNWYVMETDTTRYKSTGTHVVYDAGGPADGSASCGQSGYPACGNVQHREDDGQHGRERYSAKQSANTGIRLL